MPRRVDALWLALVLCASCAPPAAREFVVGHHQVRATLPSGWEHVDHGQEHVLRNGEARIVVTDEGFATPGATVQAIEAVRERWRLGDARDAAEQLRSLELPILNALPAVEQHEFWAYWNSVAYDASRRDTPEAEAAFDTLLARARVLEPLSEPAAARWVFATHMDTTRHEIASIEMHPSGTRAWTVLRTWNRVTHLERRWLACRVNAGSLLVVDLERDPRGDALPVFERLLASMHVGAVAR